MSVTLFQSPAAFGQASPKQPPPRSTAKLPDVKDQEQIFAYWTTETGWLSELQLRNNATSQDLSVTPVVRLPNGVETSLSPVTVKPNEVKSIDLGAAIAAASAPQLVGTYGSLVLRYRARNYRNLYAALMVRNIGHPFAFHIDAIPEAQDYQAGSREGIWWLPKSTTNDYLILTNQGPSAIPVDLSLYDASGKESKQSLVLAPRGTTRYSIRTLVSAAGLVGSFGGIKLPAAANAGSLDTVHVLFDETAAFSAILKMFDHDPNAKLDERDYAKTRNMDLARPHACAVDAGSGPAIPARNCSEAPAFHS